MARKYVEQTAKPANDAYTGMLALSFIALAVGCLFLWMDYDRYSKDVPKPPSWKVTDRAPPDAPPPASKPDDQKPVDPPPEKPPDDGKGGGT